MNHDFTCPACGWAGNRYATLRRCPKCGGRVDRVGPVVVKTTEITIRDGVLTLADGRQFYEAIQPTMFADLFPAGVKLTRVGKHELVHPVTLRRMLETADIDLLREAFIALLWNYGVHSDILDNVSAQLMEWINRATKAEEDFARIMRGRA